MLHEVKNHFTYSVAALLTKLDIQLRSDVPTPVTIQSDPVQSGLVQSHFETSSAAVRLFDPTGVKLWPQEEQNY